MDAERRNLAVMGAEDKRLMYKTPVGGFPKDDQPMDGDQLPFWPNLRNQTQWAV